MRHSPSTTSKRRSRREAGAGPEPIGRARDVVAAAERVRRRGRGAKPQLLVDVSVIIRHDAQTGIQRVVRAIWSELRALQHPDFELVAVHATKSHGYSYAPVNFLENRGVTLTQEPVRARPTDRFLGLDLSLIPFPCTARKCRHGAAPVHRSA